MKAAIRKPTGDRRAEIERAALDLAYEHGPARVSTGMIAARLGLTQPAIYKHFPSKDEIWCNVARRLAGRIGENMSLVGQARMAPVASLKQLVLTHLGLVAHNPAMPELMTMRGKSEGQLLFQGTIRKAMAGFHRALEQYVLRAVANGDFRRDLDAADAAALILGLIQSLVLRMLVTRDPGILRKDGERLLDLLLQGFGATGDRP